MRRLFMMGLVLLASVAVAAPLVWRGAVYRGTLADRPAASHAAPAAVYVVTDCTDNTCVAGTATMECITQDTGAVWDVVICNTTTSTSTSTSTTTTVTTSSTTTTT